MSATVVGIDVAKATLDVAVLPTEGPRWQVANDLAGISPLVAQLQALAPQLIVLEATGGYETAVVTALAVAGLPVAVVNPRQVRDFARALGILAKTDALDATVLALFAERVRPTPRPLPDEAHADLLALVSRRRQLVEMRTAEINRLARPASRSAAACASTSPGSIGGSKMRTGTSRASSRPVRSGGRGTNSCDRRRVSAPRPAPAYSSRYRSWAACPGGRSPRSSAWPRSIAIAGAPMPRARRGAGRAPVRATLYMATLVATRHNPSIRAFCQRLCAAGKPRKVALVAAMRKLLTMLNAMLRHQTPARAC